MKAIVRLPNSSSLTLPSVNPSRSGGFHDCGLCTVPKEMPAAFIGVHELPGDDGQIQSIGQILVDIEEHYVVEVLLGHSRSQVGFDTSDGRKGPFPS